MSNRRNFLVEIGTEELPPKALRSLMDAFAENLGAAIDAARLEHGDVHRYASPRRLAVMIESLAEGQEDLNTAQKGPPVSVAFDDDALRSRLADHTSDPRAVTGWSRIT